MSKPITNWREKHKQIKEWKKQRKQKTQKKLKQKVDDKEMIDQMVEQSLHSKHLINKFVLKTINLLIKPLKNLRLI